MNPGGPGGIRTLDLFHAMEARSQLRHRPALPLTIPQAPPRYSGCVPARSSFAVILLLADVPALAQGLPPRPDPDNYSAQARLAEATIAADYLARTIPLPSRPRLVSNYLVIELAVYPDKGAKVPVSAQHFSLRINGRKTALLPQAPGLVAAELKFPDWEFGPQIAVGAGAGDATVILGPPRPVERFPGDPRAPRTPQPAPPAHPTARDETSPVSPEEFVRQAALPEGVTSHPVAGLLYFAFKGKTRSVRSLELLYSGPAGSATLRLF